MYVKMGRKRKPIDLNTYAGLFAYRLRTLREGAGITQDELSEITGLSRTSIFDWEAARFTPTVEVLPILAIALNVSPQALIPSEIPDIEAERIKKMLDENARK